MFDEFDRLLDKEIKTTKADESLRPTVILVIDDDSRILEDLEFALRTKYRVRLCASGSEGVTSVDTDVYAVILDIKMQDKDGFWTYQEIKKRFSHLPIIFHTAYQDIKDPYDVMNEFRPFGYVTKGDDLNRLMTSVESAVRYYAQILENKTLYQNLHHAHRELLKLDEMKSKFITLASHELRTPLAVMYGYLDVIQIDSNYINPEDFQRMIGNFRKNLDKLIAIVRDIVNLSRLSSPEVVIEKGNISLTQLILDVENEVKPFIEKRHQHFHCDLSPAEIAINANRDLIWQAIINLVLNAIRFTPDGGTIRIETTQTPAQVEIRVIDTGIGIPESEYNNIFRSFYEIGNVLHHSSGFIEFMSKGLGLGLSIARAIIDLHNGKIHVTSAINQGSTFTIQLPC